LARSRLAFVGQLSLLRRVQLLTDYYLISWNSPEDAIFLDLLATRVVRTHTNIALGAQRWIDVKDALHQYGRVVHER